MSAFGNCEEMNCMDNSVLKKFAANARNVLLKNSSEECAYFGFMRLCSLFFIDGSAVYGILSAPEIFSAVYRCWEGCTSIITSRTEMR